MKIEIVVGFAQALLAVFALFLAPNIYESIRRRFSRIDIRYGPVATGRSKFRTWLVRLKVKRNVLSDEFLEIIPKVSGAKIFAFKQFGSSKKGRRGSIDHFGNLKIPLPYLKRGDTLHVRLHLSKDSGIEFSSNNVIRPEYLQQIFGQETSSRAILIARWRALWVAGLVFLITFLALTRILFLGFFR